MVNHPLWQKYDELHREHERRAARRFVWNLAMIIALAAGTAILAIFAAEL